MKNVVEKYAPAAGFTHLVHWVLVLIYPLALYILARSDFIQLALILILLSKWRMFAVRPRFWLANIRANAVDIIVGLSTLAFIVESASGFWQLLWAVLYAAWLIQVKPGASTFMNTVQAGIGLVAGLSALYISWSTGPLFGLVLATGLLCYLTARHFFDSFDEPYARMLAYVWGYFGAAVIWVLGHWLLFYGVIAQPTVLLSAIGIGAAVMYYLSHQERLTKPVKRQILFAVGAVVAIVLLLSDWSSGIV